MTVAPDQRLARQGYSAEQVDRYLRTSGLRHRTRFDLLDTSAASLTEVAEMYSGTFQKVGELDTVVREDGNVNIDVNAEQKISGTLKMDMRPDDRLRDTELQWGIRPMYLLDLPNGDTLEFECGVYTYAGADRTLDPKQEFWSLNLGDQGFWMDTQSVLLGGFGIPAGGKYSDYLKVLLALAGLFDFGGIEDSPTVADTELLWGYDRPPSLGWTGFWYWNNRDNDVNAVSIRTTTLYDIAGDICAAMRAYPPFFNRKGQPRAKHFQDLRTTDPVTQFGTAKDSILFRDMTSKSDRSKISNFVWAYTENPAQDTDSFVGTADANQYFPNHPWAANKVGHYITRSISSPFVTDWQSANELAFQALTAGLCYNQTIAYETLAYPTLEANDVVQLYVEGDHELATPTPYIEVGYKFDPVEGRMQHTARRIVMPLGDIGPIDIGLTDAWNTFALGRP